MTRSIKRNLSVILLCVILIVCAICCFSACEEEVKIEAYVDSQVYYYSSIGEMLNDKKEKTGYNFNGWYYYSNDVKTYANEELVSQKEANKYRYYAEFTPIEYNIEYLVDGEVVAVDTYTIEKKPTLPKVPEKRGYLAEWEEHEFNIGNVQLNAVYNCLSYPIHYENTFGAENKNTIDYTVECEYVFSKVERNGYSFLGWFDKAGKKVEKIEKGSIGELKLRAEWETVNYTISYVNTKGATLSGVPLNYTVEMDSLLLPALNVFGYEFSGWYNLGKKIEYIEKGTTGNLILEANWTPISYSITYNNLRGAENSNPEIYTIESNEIMLSSVYLNGYDFNGWYLGGTKVVSIAGGTTGNISLEARWTPSLYQITYNNTKGAANTNPTNYTIESAEISLQNIWSIGYSFDGWYLGGEKIESIPTNSTGNLVLEAHWTPIVYSITYHNLENATNNNPQTYTVVNGPIVLENAKKDWYTFDGWYSDALLSNRVSEIEISSPKNIELYAKWTPTTYNAYYYDGAEVVYTIKYNVGSQVWSDPEVPKKNGYSGSWSEYTPTTADIHIFAQYTPIEYGITYNDTRNAENLNATTYTVESSTIELQPLTANGYTFLGWYEDENSVSEIKSGSYGNKTLTAHWEITVYTINYENLKDATSSDLVYSYTIESEVINLPTELNATAYTFQGWIDENGESIRYIERNSFGNRVITAKFSPIVYSVAYENVNGSENVNVTTYTVESSTIALKPLTANGYTFLGWYEDENAVSEIKSGSYGNKTLTAHWKITVYTINYENLKDATSSDLVYSYTIESEVINLPTELNATAYTFQGWIDENGESIRYIERNSFGNRVITAKFSPIVYSVAYENLASANNPNETKYTIESGLSLQALSRNGYTFLGWYEGENLVSEIQIGEYGERTLSAKWEITSYTISYHNTKSCDTSEFVIAYNIESEKIILPSLDVLGYSFNGWRDDSGKRVETIESGSYGNISLTAEFSTITYDIAYKNVGNSLNLNPLHYNVEERIALKDLQRNGYTFLGWFDGENQVSTIETGTTGNIELTAKFELAVYTITYTGTFGADISGFVSSYTIESETISLPTDVKVSGYTFNGWKKDSNSFVTKIQKGSYGDVVLTAVFTPTKYVISLQAMDGSVNKSTMTVSYGQEFTLPVPTFEKGTFVGWFNNTGDNSVQMTDENGNSLNGYPYRANRTFYAHYIVNKFTVTFDADGGSSVPSQTYSSGSLFVESSAQTERGDDLFEGWFTADGTRFTNGTPIVAAVTLKAHWAESIGISDLNGLLAISENPTANYHLNNDINLKGHIWTPITTFSGVLDGKGYTLKNFILSCTTAVERFAFINENNGTVKNLNFEDFSYNLNFDRLGNVNSAIFIAVNNGTIENCSLKNGMIKINFVATSWDTYSFKKSFGSFVGVNNQNGIVKDCISSVDVISKANGYNNNGDVYKASNLTQNIFLGGIVGINAWFVENSHFVSKISLTAYSEGHHSTYVDHCTSNIIIFGGIIGQNEVGGNCKNCYNDSEIEVKTSSNSGYGRNSRYMGGVVGNNLGTIFSCRSNGNISAGGATNYTHLGGLVGTNRSNGTISNCYSTANVNSTQEGNVGGFVGYNEGIIQSSYARGTVISTAGGDVAGFVGENGTSGTITKCYASCDYIQAKSGNIGYFVANSSGQLFKCFYLHSATLMLNGAPKAEYLTEFESVNGLLYQTLWSKEFITEQIYWEEDSWVILVNEDPVLDWEIIIDDYDLTVIEPDCENMGYSVYVEKAGSRFFVRNFVEPWGHSYDEENYAVIEPTCVKQGYTEYTCLICGHVERNDYTEARGHVKSAEIDRLEPTCEEVGYSISRCEVCGEELKTALPALGHTPIVIAERINSTCGKTAEGEFYETSGLTELIECGLCHTVLQEQSEIQPHNFIVNATTAPTCTKDGYGTYTCSYENCGYSVQKEIPALGHSDMNSDHRCDVCNELIGIYEGEKFIEIKTANDLLKISSNLNGVYKLMNDIDMKNSVWTTVGTDDKPFTGYFEGNGKSIKNLVGADNSFVPMFGYLRGVVHNLTLNYESGITIRVSENENAGILAETNDGAIVACKVAGKIAVEFSYVSTSNEFANTDQVGTGIFGGIVFTNGILGVISDCTVSAEFIIRCTHSYTLTTARSISLYLGGLYKFKHTSVLNVYFAPIAGINRGVIKTCTISGSVQNNDSDVQTKAKTMNANGHVYVTTNVYVRNYVAINHSTIENCESANFYKQTLSRNSVRYVWKFWTESEVFNSYFERNEELENY